MVPFDPEVDRGIRGVIALAGGSEADRPQAKAAAGELRRKMAPARYLTYFAAGVGVDRQVGQQWHSMVNALHRFADGSVQADIERALKGVVDHFTAYKSLQLEVARDMAQASRDGARQDFNRNQNAETRKALHAAATQLLALQDPDLWRASDDVLAGNLPHEDLVQSHSNFWHEQADDRAITAILTNDLAGTGLSLSR